MVPLAWSVPSDVRTNRERCWGPVDPARRELPARWPRPPNYRFGTVVSTVHSDNALFVEVLILFASLIGTSSMSATVFGVHDWVFPEAAAAASPKVDVAATITSDHPLVLAMFGHAPG
jgi:hypothetical protein